MWNYNHYLCSYYYYMQPNLSIQYQNTPFDFNYLNFYHQTDLKTEIDNNEKINVPQSQPLKLDLSKNSQNLINGILSKEDMDKLCVQRIQKIWTEEQDAILIKLIKQNDQNWQIISELIPNKTASQCMGRYKRIKQSIIKRKWTKQEDQKIKQCVNIYGFVWRRFTSHFQDRTSKQIRERYLNYLKPNIVERKWQFEEDLLLSNLVNKYGRRWKLFETFFPQRSQNKIKNRYCGHIQRVLRIKQRQMKEVEE